METGKEEILYGRREGRDVHSENMVCLSAIRGSISARACRDSGPGCGKMARSCLQW